MKIFAVLLLALFALMSSTVALKSAECGLPHSVDGDGQRACQAFFQNWSYKADANECVQFIYGGCGGNANRFESKNECESKCKE